MAIRLEREKSKMQETYHMILTQMLKEEDNKYCVDCDVRSPRWTSWNLGVFICIRCAGFHRNLGVHISKVKSINLDSWTGEQIASMQAMGNSRARAVYEANLPDGFRRPQTDSTLESFIRTKYEQRKWIAKEWIPFDMTLIDSEPYSKRLEPILTTERVIEKKLEPFSIIIEEEPVESSKTLIIKDNNTENLLNLNDSSTSVNSPEINTDISSINQELINVFSFPSNTIPNNSNKIMSNETIMALFNTSPTSIVNVRPVSIQIPHYSSSGFIPSKSFSFNNNLSQQTSNFISEHQIHSTFDNHHLKQTNVSSTFTSEQLNTQFSQLLTFENIKKSSSNTFQCLYDQ